MATNELDKLEPAAVKKVTAYITREREGRTELLVFLETGHEHLGYQVPGGTVEAGERLEEALVREIWEEAGIVPHAMRLIGEHAYFSDVKQRDTLRYYYHMQVPEDCPETFTHQVQSDDEDNGWIYRYEWVDLAELKELFGFLGVHLHQLKKNDAS